MDLKGILRRRDEQVAALTKLVVRNYPDPRSVIGQKYFYKTFVQAIFTAVAAGMRSIRSIHEFLHSQQCQRFFGNGDRPSYNCLRNLISRWDGSILLNQIEDYLIRDIPIGIAIDGKTLRRARNNGDRAGAHFLNIATHDGIILDQIQIPEKTNEIPAATVAIRRKKKILKGRVITFDALHTQTWLARVIHGIGAAYLFTVKDNQSKLLQECKYFLDCLKIGTHTTVEKGHGRIETREITLATAPSTIKTYWEGCSYIFKIVSTRENTVTGKTETETHWGITNLSDERATPENVLALKRNHWSIENKLHYVLDDLFAEDRCRCRTGSLAGVMTALRKTGIALLRRIAGNQSLTSVARRLAIG